MENASLKDRRCNQLRKTQMCGFYLRGRCGKGEACTYAHDPSEIRERPDLQRTSICKALQKNGVCTDPKCSFAHHERELRATEGFFKTKLCRFAGNGRCKNGKNCRFAHGKQELTEIPGAPEAQPRGSSDEELDAFAGFMSQVPVPYPPNTSCSALHLLQAVQGQLARSLVTDFGKPRTLKRTIGSKVQAPMAGGASSASDSTQASSPYNTPVAHLTDGPWDSPMHLEHSQDISKLGEEKAMRNCTTILAFNFPRFLTQGAFISLLEDLAPEECAQIDFVFLPWDVLEEQNLGYAVMNFFCGAACEAFELRWSSRSFPGNSGETALHMVPSAVQGRVANELHFRNACLASHDAGRFSPAVRLHPGDALLPVTLKEGAYGTYAPPATALLGASILF